MEGTLTLERIGIVGTFLAPWLHMSAIHTPLFVLAGPATSIGAALVLASRSEIADRLRRRPIVAAGGRRP